ncbi:MAG: hypothetical protein ABSC19_14985 [Syntrophorhabdales bacterium]
MKINEALAEIGYKTHWQPRPTGHITGYHYTQRLVVTLGFMVVVAAAFGALVSILASIGTTLSIG